jgi:hypothetical protein
MWELLLRTEVEWEVQGADADRGCNQQDYADDISDDSDSPCEDAAKTQEQKDNPGHGTDNAVNIGFILFHDYLL